MEVECRFCKNDIPKKESFKLTEPTGVETHFCSDCAADMLRYIESGEAERENLKQLNDPTDPNVLPSATLWPASLTTFNYKGKGGTFSNGVQTKDFDSDDVPF